MITLTPAYGRDYKSKAAISVDLGLDKDFIFSQWGSPWDGKPVNLEQLQEMLAPYAGKKINVRYGNLRKVAVISL